jgi:hypothetical protein
MEALGAARAAQIDRVQSLQLIASEGDIAIYRLASH